MMRSLHAVIMAGGSGTRFWPASRKERPKQFLPLAHGVPLLQATLDRLVGLCSRERTWIVTNAAQAKLVTRLLPDFPPAQIIVEPEARDTAPCVALATATIAALDADATMIVLPADHVIAPRRTFHAMLRRGVALARDDRTLVTFGVTPSHPATGYGYLECGDRLDAKAPPAFAARRFREKPDAATARRFLRAGRFLWNSGIFVWTVPAIRHAMATANNELDHGVTALLAAKNGAQRLRAFRAMPKTSIDFGVMERAPHVAVVRADLQWDDIGSFPALTAVGSTDRLGNTALLSRGASQLPLQSHGNVVYAEGQRTVALFGVDDLVVVAVDDVVLVCPKARAADLKLMVEHARASGRTDLL